MAEETGEKSKNWFAFCQQHNLFYYGAAALFATLTVIAAFSENADAWPLLILAGLCLLVPNLDRLQSIQVSASGVMANLQKATADANTVTDEAKKLLETLRDSTIDTSVLSLELVQRSGWLGGFDEDVKKSVLESVTKTLKETGVTDEEIDRILLRTWYRYDFQTYASHILGHGTIPGFGHPAPFNQEDPDETNKANEYRSHLHAEWKSLRDRWPNEAATPDELAAFIDKTGDDDQERQRILEAYRYYLEHKTHQDMELWINRNRIPPIKINKIPQDAD